MSVRLSIFPPAAWAGVHPPENWTGLTVLDRAPAHGLPAASAFWHERTHAVESELERRHGDQPAWRTAEAQSGRIGHLLKQGQLQSQVLLLQR